MAAGTPEAQRHVRMSACTTTTTITTTIPAAAAAAGRSVHYPGDPCGDGEETPLTLHCFFMPVSFPLSEL